MGATLALLLFVVGFVVPKAYLQQLAENVAQLPHIWTDRFVEWAEIAVNIPVSRVPPTLASLFPLLGVAILLVAVFSLWVRRRNWGAGDVYLIAYSAILMVWPFNDNRFWLPVIPFFIGSIVEVATRYASRVGLLRWAAVLFAFAYVTGGVIALGYSTRLSLAGPEFAGLYGSPEMQNAYREAYGLPADSSATTHAHTLYLLERFDWYAQRQ
jgi:hypothetical protein